MNSKAVLFAVSAMLLAAVLPGAGYGREAGGARERERDAGEFREGAGGSYNSGEYDEVRSLQQRGAILPLQQILERARRHHDGKVLETELEQKGGHYVYEIELVDGQGQVWEMKFDAGSGELLKDSRED